MNKLNSNIVSCGLNHKSNGDETEPFMEALLEQLPQTGDIQVTFQISAHFNYSAIAAQRLARRFVADEIGYLLRVGDPSLVMSARMAWRVPILLALPSHGVVGQVGAVDVDVETGSILITPSQIREIALRAREIAERYSHPSATPATA